MSKEEIIRYYENLIDKCHQVIFEKRDKIRGLKQTAISMEFHVARNQRQNNELNQQLDILKKEFAGRMQLMQNDKNSFQQQLFQKDVILKQYQQAFEDLKCKNYQMENVAFTYHMTLQRLKDKELELAQKLEEVQSYNRRIETALRLKNEENYQLSREKEQLIADLKNNISVEDNLRQEIIQVCIQRDEVEKQINMLKEKIGHLNIEIMKLRNENDRLNREKMLSKGGVLNKPLINIADVDLNQDYLGSDRNRFSL